MKENIFLQNFKHDCLKNNIAIYSVWYTEGTQ